MAEEMPVYPAGTPLEDVKVFDRGTKVLFKCTEHPQWTYASKDPYVSNWFPGDRVTGDAEFRGECNACQHSIRTPGQYVLAEEYRPTRNG